MVVRELLIFFTVGGVASSLLYAMGQERPGALLGVNAVNVECPSSHPIGVIPLGLSEARVCDTKIRRAEPDHGHSPCTCRMQLPKESRLSMPRVDHDAHAGNACDSEAGRLCVYTRSGSH
jgi:hypothetical protein